LKWGWPIALEAASWLWRPVARWLDEDAGLPGHAGASWWPAVAWWGSGVPWRHALESLWRATVTWWLALWWATIARRWAPIARLCAIARGWSTITWSTHCLWRWLCQCTWRPWYEHGCFLACTPWHVLGLGSRLAWRGTWRFQHVAVGIIGGHWTPQRLRLLCEELLALPEATQTFQLLPFFNDHLD